MDEPLVWYEGSGTSDKRYFHADERGSIIAVTDGAGAVIGINSYDEYGKGAPTNIGRFQYTGQAYIPELGIYYYKARWLDPQDGKFMQGDPLGFKAGPNFYTYTGGDPVNSTDPSGLMETCTGTFFCGSNTVFSSYVSCSGNCATVTPGVSGNAGNSGGGGSGGSGSSNHSGSLVGGPQAGNSSCIGCITNGNPGIPRSIIDHQGFYGGNIWYSVSFTNSALAQYQLAGIIGTQSPYNRAIEIANEELARTRAVAPPEGGHNDIYDAERHARWVYRMAKEISPFYAQLFSEGHEYANLINGGSLREYYMDLHNNSIGLSEYSRGNSIPNTGTPGLIYKIRCG